MKIKPCIIGLGYVGLPALVKISKKFNTFGFDIDPKRIKTLKKNQDTNLEFSRNQLLKIKKKILHIK